VATPEENPISPMPLASEIQDASNLANDTRKSRGVNKDLIPKKVKTEPTKRSAKTQRNVSSKDSAIVVEVKAKNEHDIPLCESHKSDSRQENPSYKIQVNSVDEDQEDLPDYESPKGSESINTNVVPNQTPMLDDMGGTEFSRRHDSTATRNMLQQLCLIRNAQAEISLNQVKSKVAVLPK